MLVYLPMAVLALLTVKGFARPRVALLAVTVVGILLGEADRITTRSLSPSLADYAGLALNVLILLALTSRDARVWSRRTSTARAAARRGRNARG